jgi:hypothetical protein
MAVLGVSTVTRWGIYLTVRAFGWFAWWRNQADRAAGFDRVMPVGDLKAAAESARPGALRRVAGRLLR